MEVKMMPVIDSYELQEAMKAQYGPDFFGEDGTIEDALFEDYNNNTCEYYFYGSDEKYEGKFWQVENYVRIRNCINGYLRDILPDYERVLISISW